MAASSGATTRFFAAEWSGGVVSSADGQTWQTLGTGFPKTSVGRIALGVQANNPNVVYALSSRTRMAFSSASIVSTRRRTPGSASRIRRTCCLPRAARVRAITICASPSIRAMRTSSTSAVAMPTSIDIPDIDLAMQGCARQYYRMDAVSIGTNAHSDVHVLVHVPGDLEFTLGRLRWWRVPNRDPRSSDTFKSRNNGLSCLCTNFFSQHPTIRRFDRGTFRKWALRARRADRSGNTSHGADGGYMLINWADPLQQASGVSKRKRAARDRRRSEDHASFSVSATAEQYGTVDDDRNRSSARRIIQRDPSTRRSLHSAPVSTFTSRRTSGKTWPTSVVLGSKGSAFHRVCVADKIVRWHDSRRSAARMPRQQMDGVTRIDNVAAGALPLTGLVSDVVIDRSDATGAEVYLAFGGSGDYLTCMAFQRIALGSASGAAGIRRDPLDVEHNALIVDRQAPQNVYVGADIGVWHSADKGVTWCSRCRTDLPYVPASI